MKMVGHIEDIKGNPSSLLSLLDQANPSKNLPTNDMFEDSSIFSEVLLGPLCLVDISRQLTPSREKKTGHGWQVSSRVASKPNVVPNYNADIVHAVIDILIGKLTLKFAMHRVTKNVHE